MKQLASSTCNCAIASALPAHATGIGSTMAINAGIGKRRATANGPAGTWQAIHVATAKVFSPYHQRPKDAVT